MAGRARVFSQLVLDLVGDPSLDSPTEIEVCCDCLRVCPQDTVLPLSVRTDFCMLSSDSSRAQGLRGRIYSWCEAHGVSLFFACKFWERAEGLEVRLRRQAPGPGLEE